MEEVILQLRGGSSFRNGVNELINYFKMLAFLRLVEFLSYKYGGHASAFQPNPFYQDPHGWLPGKYDNRGIGASGSTNRRFSAFVRPKYSCCDIEGGFSMSK